jgi:putative exporter of polyketide antibiotics
VSRLPDPEQEPVPEPPDPAGRVGTTRPGTLVLVGLVALVTGWALRPASIALQGTAPRVAWVQVLALVLVALILGAVAWSTHRTLQTRHQRLAPHQAVNRLVLGKACALGGAFVMGAYLGHALSWVGIASEIVRDRLLTSLIAAGGAALMTGCALLLERACRVPGGDEEPQ